MRKLSSFKKGMIYALATLLVIPTWLASGIGSVEKVKAADYSHEYYNGEGSTVYTENNPVNWNPSGYMVGGRWTDEPNELAEWEFIPRVSGEYKVSANWGIHSNQAEHAYYVVTDENGDNPPIEVNQKKNADNTKASNGTVSDYKNLGTYNFVGGNSYNVKISGVIDSNNHLYAGWVKIEHDNEVPDQPVLVAPINQSYQNTTVVNFDWSATDIDDNEASLDYELYVDDDSSFTSPIINKNAFDRVDFSNYSDTISSDGKYYWYVKSWDGEYYSQSSQIYEFVIDKTIPVISLSGPTTVVVERGETYVEPGYSANDNYDGDITMDVVVDTSALDTNIVDSYQVTYNVSDVAGNPAVEKIRTINVEDTIGPIAPVITVSKDDKTINLNFNGVGGGVEYYEVYVNGVLNEKILVSGDDSGYEYKRDITVLEYGNYEVYVVAFESGNFGKSNVEKVSLTSSEPEATVTPAVATTTSTVAPETASAADDSAVQIEEGDDEDGDEVLDEDGKIKGEEDEEAAEDEDINWTPWIILFILIILAGAATGGYFYWFADEEEVETKIREEKKPIKKSAPKKSNKSKGSNKRRW